MKTPYRVAVIGATGFIGSHLTARLAASGATVLAIARSRARLENLSGVWGACEFAECDIGDAARLRWLLEKFGPAVVYHLASHPDAKESFDQIRKCLAADLAGLTHVLEAASSCGTKLFVYGDSSKVHGNAACPHREGAPTEPESSYAIAKLAGWQLTKLVSAMTGMQVVSLRPEFTYGPRQAYNLIVYVQQCVLAGRPILLQGGSQTRDPLYVEDLVDAFVAVPEHPESFGHAISLGGGQEITVTELCREILAAMGRHAVIEAASEPPRLTEIWRSYADNSDALDWLGWRPKTSLREGLRKTLGEFAGRPAPLPADSGKPAPLIGAGKSC